MLSGTRVIGIDPSLRATGLAWRNRAGEWEIGLCPGDHSLVGASLGLAHHDGIKIAYIEDGYMGPNAKVSKQLDQLRGRMQERCTRAGMKYVMVNPKTWQALMLGDAKGHKELKAMSIKVAQDLGADVTGPNGKPGDDMADAVCLAEYGGLNANLVDQEGDSGQGP